MPQQQRVPPQQGNGGTASWALRGRTADYTPEEQQQVELTLRKHGQTTDATERAARVSYKFANVRNTAHAFLTRSYQSQQHDGMDGFASRA